jgi:hypothetical protein
VYAAYLMRPFDAASMRAFYSFLLRFALHAPYSMPEDLQAWN